jgi:hypothetical protein
MNNNALILTGSGYGLEVAPEALSEKSRLLKHSSLVIEVNDDASCAAGAHQVKQLAAMRSMVEKSRKAIKEPVLRVGKDIDAKAAEFLAELESEEGRIKHLIGEYAREVENKRQAAERERQRLAAEEFRRQQEAERQRVAEDAKVRAAEQAAEAARAKAEAAMWEDGDDAKEQAAAAAEAKRKADEEAAAQQAAEEARREADRVAAEESRRVEAAAAAKTSGVKMVPDYEVTDIHALYAHNVGLVTLTERRAQIIEAIKLQTIGETLPTIPGLRVFLKPSVATR